MTTFETQFDKIFDSNFDAYYVFNDSELKQKIK